MDALKSLPLAFDSAIKTDQTSPALNKITEPLTDGRKPSATEPGDDILTRGATSIADIEKLMEELRTARDYLKAEGERIRRANARYAHLTSTASASVKIIAESMGKWRTTEIEAAPEAETVTRRQAMPLQTVVADSK